jgi:plasmid stabilization system protein ParE
MKYHVVYQPTAEDQLADIWTVAPDQIRVTRAADRIDALLTYTPTTVGESRAPGVRVLFEDPLVVTYEVIEDDKRVTVLRVARTTS